MTAELTKTEPALTPAPPHRWRTVVTGAPVLQAAAVLVLFGVGIATIGGFGDRASLDGLLVLTSFLGIAAAGQTLVVLIGGLDMSVPALISAANLMTALLSGRGWPFAAVIAIVLAGCAIVGMVNGYLSHRFKVPALIITLGTGSVAAGLVLGWTQGGQVTGQVPGWLSAFTSPIGTVGPLAIPPVVVLWVAIGVLITVVLGATVTGRRLFATGANPRAARLALVRTDRIWTGTFCASAVCSGVVGILLTGFSGTGQPGVGDPYLFASLAAVLVGGTSLIGARGDYTRTILGTLIMILLPTLLLGHGYDTATQQILIGIVILAVVAVYGRTRRLRDRI